MSFEVKTITTSGFSGVVNFDNKKQALAFCNEEVKWESAKLVECKDDTGEVIFSQAGDFASVIS